MRYGEAGRGLSSRGLGLEMRFWVREVNWGGVGAEPMCLTPGNRRVFRYFIRRWTFVFVSIYLSHEI